MHDVLIKPDYIFETSWEVCNKVGGIHTVLCTKARHLQQWNDHILMLGPELQKDKEASPEFIEDKELFPLWKEQPETMTGIIRLRDSNQPSYFHYSCQHTAIKHNLVIYKILQYDDITQ